MSKAPGKNMGILTGPMGGMLTGSMAGLSRGGIPNSFLQGVLSGSEMKQAPIINPTHSLGFRRLPPNRQRALSADNLPINEAAKRDLASLPTKTPVSVLQELLARRGTAPKYELVQIEGLIHEPIFRYRVTIGDVIAIGTGRSKKQAKHKAAKTLLDKLAGEGLPDSTTNVSISSDGDTTTDTIYDSNPIGWLQEMCMKRFMPPPRYVTEMEETGNGPPHERLFTVACLLMNYRKVGHGKSKKVAKRQAAHNMWQFLQEGKQEPVANNNEVTVKNNKNFNYVKYLQDIAAEATFEVTFVEIEEKSLTKQSQCLVQLSTLPVAVCYGSGNNLKEAQASAAQNALEYLKIMMKK